MYVGTGEPNCGGGSVTYDGMGVFKSTDAGATWNYAGLDSTRNTGRIIIDPKNAERVFVATMGDLFANGPDRGVYRTLDGGASWERVLFLTDSTGAIDLAIHPQHSRHDLCLHVGANSKANLRTLWRSIVWHLSLI
jgi:photosystem II stability/assembly factor-like uncharacterized protein